MFGVHVVWQQWVYNVDGKVFPVETGIHLLLRGNDLINPGIESISIRRNRNQCLVIDTTRKTGSSAMDNKCSAAL